MSTPSSRSGLPLEENQQCLHDLFISAAEKHPSRKALVCMHQPASLFATAAGGDVTGASYLSWTHAQLVRAGHAFARALVAAGVRPGMKIVVVLSACAEYHLALRASLELGCSFAPLSPHLVANVPTLKHSLAILKPSVVIVQDEQMAQSLDDAVPESMESGILRLIAGTGANLQMQTWQSLDTFLTEEQSNKAEDAFDISKVVRTMDDIVVILFTSGTTSMPKGCPTPNRAITSTSRSWAQACTITADDVACHYLPMNHVFALNVWIVGHQIQGACVVHPAAAFEAGAVLEAIRKERCNALAGVPAIVHLLIQHPDFRPENVEHMRLILLGATTILPADIQACQGAFNADTVMDGYSMTEANAGCCIRYTKGASLQGDGFVSPGAHLRICEPDTQNPVARGEEGEIHLGGDGVVGQYWLAPDQNAGKNPFYTDGEVRWIRTGDRGKMSEGGQVRIVGRYKDMIIRGGENIAPASIEAVLADKFGLKAQVVGQPDDLAGEVPIAVIKKDDKDDEGLDYGNIRECLRKELGAPFVLEGIVSTDDLGVQDFPKTATGKVQKNVLKDMLGEYMHEQESGKIGGEVTEQQGTVTALCKIWTQLLGVGKETLTAESHLTDWADSLTMGRAPRVLQQKLGLKIGAHEILTKYGTIQSQAELHHNRGKESSTTNVDEYISTRTGPPGVDDMPHASGDLEVVRRTASACDELLAPLGLGWDDVEDVVPMYSFQKRFLTRRRLQSNNHRHAWASPAPDTSQLRKAVETALTNNAILRTMVVQLDGEEFNVIVRPSTKFFDRCITIMDDIETIDDAKTLVYQDMRYDYAADPGPLFRAVLALGKKEKRAVIVYMAQHSVFDGNSIPFFLHDLDATLRGSSLAELPKRVPYKMWADCHHNLSTSKAARRSVDWHVRRLLDARIQEQRQALFPTQRADEWFKGCAAGSEAADSRRVLDQEPSGEAGLVMPFELRGVSELRRKYGIEASQVVKAALAILNHRQTKSRTALFYQYQAARQWSFLPAWHANRLPPIMDVNGPTVQIVLNAIRIEDSQTVEDLLQSLQAEQQLLNEHAAAPFDAIIDRLNEHDPRAGGLAIDVWRRQIFNWLPPDESGELQCIQKIQQISRTDVGLLWNVMSVGAESIRLLPSWDDAQLRRSEVEGWAQDIIRFAQWLSKKDNWNRPITDILA